MGSREYDAAELAADDEERIICACCVCWPEAVAKVRERLTVADFRREDTRAIFQAVCNVADRGEPALLTRVCREVGRLGHKKLAFGSDLVSWFELVDSPHWLRWHTEAIIAAAQRRRLWQAGGKVAQQATATGLDADGAVKAAQEIVGQVARLHHAQPEMLDPESFALMAIERNAAMESGVADPVLSFGLADLDEQTIGGARPGQLIVVGGRPGMGKSALLRDMARAFALAKRGDVLFASNEMSASQIAVRDLAALSGLALSTIISGRWTESQREALTRAESNLAFTPVHTFVDSALTSAKLRARALELHARCGLCAIVVDYLQRINDPGKSTLERVGHAARSLKSLAIELNVPVIVGSQLSREAEKTDSKRPKLSDLRETGEIEQEADVVLLLYREGYYEATKGNTAEILIAKQRQGASGQTVRVAWLGSMATFRNLARREE